MHLARNSETCFVHVHDGTRITQRNRNFVMFRETPQISPKSPNPRYAYRPRIIEVLYNPRGVGGLEQNQNT